MRNFPENVVAVVAGSGDICISVITALLSNDATVIVPVKSYEEIKYLQHITAGITTGELVPVLADIPDQHRATYLFEDIELRFGQINLTIIVFDNDYPDTPLTETPYEEWERMQRDSISACFIVGKVVLEFMKRNLRGIYRNAHGIYVAVSDTTLRGRPRVSPLNALAAYMQAELSKIFAREVEYTGIKFHHIITGDANTPTNGRDIAQYILNLCTA